MVVREPGGDMQQVDTTSNFAQVIQDHLALKERNALLEQRMPLEHYKDKVQDPFENHPLFKTEEQARIEETMDGVESAEPVVVADHEPEKASEVDDSLWGKSRDFDWGD
ncbi:MAG: hypothetical protein WD689_07310 [Gaiellaceae bacterium]